jgi:tRNA(Ile)-lysidine synthase
MTPNPVLHQLQEGLSAVLNAHSHIQRLIVGYSGGLDSHVLLHLLATQRHLWSQRTLMAVYVNHGLQPAATAWGEHCRHICQQLDVPFRILLVKAQAAPGESPEAAARQARYTALAAELESDAALLTAHHRDDQAETLLLQLLRGAGPHGLAAMPTVAPLGQGWLLRPLLDADRADLRAYAHDQQLHWIDDASNADPDFDRNYLRHRIMPLLRERWPATNRVLARSAHHCAEVANWLDAEADADLARAAAVQPDGLHLPALCALSEPRQRNLLRRWLRKLGLPVPDARQLHHILHDAVTAGRDRQPWIRWRGGEARRYRDTLYALPPLAPHDARQVFTWQAVANDYPPLELPGLGTLQLQNVIGAGLRGEALAGATLTVGFRQGGERFRPVGRAHSQELKKLLQDAGIPPWQRDRLPLLFLGSEEKRHLLAVVGLGIAADHAAAPDQPGCQPVLQSLSAVRSGIV